MAWSCDSVLPLFTPVRISSTVHCRAACPASHRRTPFSSVMLTVKQPHKHSTTLGSLIIIQKPYLTVLSSLLKRGSRLFRSRHISSFEDLIVFLRLAELDVHLHSPAAKLLRVTEKRKHKLAICGSNRRHKNGTPSPICPSELTLASLPLFLNLFRRATFSDIFRYRGEA